MSVLFGVVDRRDCSRVATYVAKMNAALSAHGTSDVLWAEGDTALGRRARVFSPEEVRERQPLKSRDGQVVVVLNGRIENRAELRDQLARPSTRSEPPTNAALVVAAFERWGHGCASHIMGTFSFAVWDKRSDSLLLARSRYGAPPLFYYASHPRFAFATMPQALLALPFVPRDIDAQSVGDWVTGQTYEWERSLYRAVSRVERGQSLVLSPGGHKAFVDGGPELGNIVLPRDQDYEEQFLALFQQAVEDHLRSVTPVGLFMSGGLDSTSIAAISADVLATKGHRLAAFLGAPRQGFQYTPATHDVILDETPLATRMPERYNNLDLTVIRSDGQFFLHDVERFFTATYAPFRHASNRVWWEALMRNAKARGIRVMLTGRAGNSTISYGGSGLYEELLRSRRWRLAWREARALQDGARRTFRTTLGPLLSHSLALAAPGLWQAQRKWRDRPSAGTNESPAWQSSPISPVFFRSQQQRWAERTTGPYSRSIAGNARARRLAHLNVADCMADVFQGYEALYDVQTRDPTLDARVVDFCLALPESQYARAGTSRWLLRRCMADRLPAEILDNNRVGIPCADHTEPLRAARNEIAADLDRFATNEVARTCLDLPRLAGLVRDMPFTESVSQELAHTYRFVLEPGLMIGRFLCWFDGHVGTGLT